MRWTASRIASVAPPEKKFERPTLLQIAMQLMPYLSKKAMHATEVAKVAGIKPSTAERYLKELHACKKIVLVNPRPATYAKK